MIHLVEVTRPADNVHVLFCFVRSSGTGCALSASPVSQTASPVYHVYATLVRSAYCSMHFFSTFVGTAEYLVGSLRLAAVCLLLQVVCLVVALQPLLLSVPR